MRWRKPGAKSCSPALLRGLGSIIAVVGLLALCCAAHAAYPMKVKDDRGREVVIKARPMRIVSLAPGNTEILFALGLEDRVVGVTRFCNYPAGAKKKRRIGDMTVSTETVLALKPDLVLAHAFMNDAVIPRLEKLGLTVFAIDPKTIGQAVRNIRTVGRITGRPATAERVARGMESTIRSVKAHPLKGKPKVLVVVQSSPLWVAGPRTFVDEMLALAGAKNAAYDARPGFNTFSKELAVTRSPDVILVGLKTDADYFLKNPAWKNTPAAKHKRVYVIDNDLIMRAGPRLADGLKTLARTVGGR